MIKHMQREQNEHIWGSGGGVWQNNRRRTLTIWKPQFPVSEQLQSSLWSFHAVSWTACGGVLELLSRGMRGNLLMKVQNYLDPLVETMLLFMNFCSQHVFPITTMFKALIYFSRKDEYVKYFASVLQCVISWPPTGNQLPSEGLQWVKVPWTISFLVF